MSQSKMSSSENEIKFVVRHSFENVMNMKVGESVDGPIEKHFNIPWKMRFSRQNNRCFVCLDCMASTADEVWSVGTILVGKIHRKTSLFRFGGRYTAFSKKKPSFIFMTHSLTDLPEFLIDGSYKFEFHVTIKEATGVDLEVARTLRRFDDEAAKETSDVTLIVKDQKFHVLKMYLAAHSTYFKTLFLGNFSEAGKSEIELKDIDPNDFQLFLELIYGESAVEDSSVLKIVHLADFFDSKSAMRRCEYFLLGKSFLSPKEKLHASLKYKLEDLKKICVAQLKTHADILSIIPEDPSQFDYALWKELLVKAISMGK